MRKIGAIAFLFTAAWASASQPPGPCVVRGQFKGVEIYSWRLPHDKWAFAVVPGTNREKTESEIRLGRRCIHDLGDVKRVVSSLGEGDEAFWLERRSSGFEIPPNDIVQEVEVSARHAGVKVHVLSTGQK